MTACGRTLVVALIALLAVACDEPPVPTAPPVAPAVAVAAQTTAPAPQTTGAAAAAAAQTAEPPASKPRPDWVLRYGNDYKERFPTVKKGGRSYSDADRIRQNERSIAFWHAHEAGERAVLHVDYLKGAHGNLFYWRLITEDGTARLVKLGRQSTVTANAPFGGNPLFWRLMSETPVSELRLGRLRWDDERARFKALRPPFKADGPALGFEFKKTADTNRHYFPPILRSIKAE